MARGWRIADRDRRALFVVALFAVTVALVVGVVLVFTVGLGERWRDGSVAGPGVSVVVAAIALLGAGLGLGWCMARRRVVAAGQRAARAGERRFRDAIEHMPDGILVFDSDDRLIAWNRRYVELQPCAQAVLRVGLPAGDLVTHVIGCVTAAGGTAVPAEERLAARAQERGTEFVTAAGRIVEEIDRRLDDGGMVTIHRDLTAERRLLVQLARSETRFRDFASSASDWFWETDAEGRYTYMSHGVRAVGIDPEDLIGKPRHAFSDSIGSVSPEDRERMRGVFAARTPFRNATYAIRRADGSELVFEVDGKPLFDDDGELIGHRGGTRDVTAVRAAERKLAENERRAREFAEEASDWTWEIGPDGRFTFVSDGVRRVGLSPDDFIGRSRDDLPYAVPAGAPGLHAIEAAVAERRPFRDVVVPARLAGGRTLQISLTGWPRLADDGGYLGYRGVGRDVAETMRQQEELARALAAEREMNQQQRRFIAVASHEFRTPLAVIDGAAQRIRARLGRIEDDDVVKRLDRIRSAVARMTDLIERTLSTARLDEGRIALQPQVFDLSALLNEICERERSISAEFVIASEIAPTVAIEGDPRLLDQVFTNLLSNAVKYSGRSRRIDVSLQATPEMATVQIRDYGIGMAPDDCERLFQRFFRASTAHGIAGTGIGLHLVRELVRLHGGTIAVMSTLGAGSTFVVRLRPRLQAAASRDEAAE